jgi:hypothetical protein
MPAYLRNGEVEVGFASQKAFVALYILRKPVLDAHAGRLAGLSLGKGAIRFRRADQIDPDVVRVLLQATAADSGPIC